MDPKSDLYYYYNCVTNRTTNNKPQPRETMLRRRRQHFGSSVRLAASPASSSLWLLLLLLLLASIFSLTNGLQQPLSYSSFRRTTVTTTLRSTTITLYAAGATNRNDDSIQEDTTLSTKGTIDVIIEVCTSPGCCADGASNTLVRLQGLQALTTPSKTSVQIREGGCRSLCGNGPVVSVTSSSSSSSSSTKIIRQVKGNDKMMHVLSNLDGDKADIDGDVASLAPTNDLKTIMDAFNLLDEAKRNEQNKQGDGKEVAVRFYQQGIELGLKAQQQLKGDKETSIDKVAWLIEALHTQTDYLLQLKRFAEAADAADAAVHLCDSCTSGREETDNDNEGDSKINSYLYASLERLQASLEQQKDTTGLSSSSPSVAEREGAALERLLTLTPPAKLSTAQLNKRRPIGFRLQKLQR